MWVIEVLNTFPNSNQTTYSNLLNTRPVQKSIPRPMGLARAKKTHNPSFPWKGGRRPTPSIKIQVGGDSKPKPWLTHIG